MRSSHRTPVFGTAVAVLGALVLGACAVDGPTATRSDATAPTDPPAEDPVEVPADPPVDPIEWGACDDDAVDVEGFECATLTVPLDHAGVDDGSIDLALIRLPATGDRRGAILLNPGGPGGSGFEFATVAASLLANLGGVSSFDIVGFDPRGVDRSSGLRCVDDDELDEIIYLDPSPDTDAEQAELDAADQTFIDGCRERYGDDLRHYSTEATARDMDLIRAAMGDEQLDYLGVSYGTYLGATYATLFPERVRSMVLDSGFAPDGDTIEQRYLTQLRGFEQAFENWATWCDETPDQCPFGGDDAAEAWDELRGLLDEPLPTSDGRSANQAVFETATITALYDEGTWAVLGAALDRAANGDGTGLLTLADQYVGREPDGSYATISQANQVISCASSFSAGPPDDPDALAALIRAEAPRFGRDVEADDLVDDCDELLTAIPPAALGYDGDAPIVVIGGLEDPATPLRWSEELADTLGPSARLVVWTGEGHGQLLTSTCLRDLAVATFEQSVLPESGTSCDPDPPIERPDYWDDLPVPDGIDDPVSEPGLAALLGLPDSFAYTEVRSTELDGGETLDRYDDALTDAGFRPIGRQQPLTGADQAIYLGPDGEAFSVLYLGDEALAEDEFAAVRPLVPAGRALVVLLHFPL